MFVLLGVLMPDRAASLALALRERLDAEVTVFQDGLDLYAAAQLGPTDGCVVVVEEALPRIGGLVMARLLKYHDDLRGICVVLLASRVDECLSLAAEEARVDHVLHFSDEEGDEALALRVADVLRIPNSPGAIL